MKKLIWISGLALVSFLGVFFHSIFNSMDSAVHISMEKHASRILQVPVRIKKVDINPFDGKGVIEGLSVESPMGFESPYVIKLRRITVKLNVNATGDGLICLREVVFDSPKIFYETRENTSNLEMIDQNIMSQQILADRRAASVDYVEDKEQSVKLVIDNLHIKNTRVVLINHPSKQTHKTLPAIHLQDIGKQSDEVTPMEAVWPVISILTESIISVLGDFNLPNGGIKADSGQKEVIFSSRNDESKKSL